jgi:hypothetical protein
VKRLISAFISISVLSGCVGVIALHPESTTYTAPFARDSSYTDSAGKLRSTGTTTQDAFLREWGPPSSKTLGPDGESWTYQRGKEWCGVILGVIIPVPLVLPVCTAEDKIVFQDGVARSITVSTTTERGVMCGLMVNGLHGGPELCTK